MNTAAPPVVPTAAHVMEIHPWRCDCDCPVVDVLKRDVLTGTLSQDMTHAKVKLRVTICSSVGQYECFVTTDRCLFLPQTVFFLLHSQPYTGLVCYMYIVC